MVNNFETRLRNALSQLQFSPEQVHLESTDSGKIGGHIISAHFTGKSQLERQNLLWEGLEQQLEPDELKQIVALLTVTPEEIADD